MSVTFTVVNLAVWRATVCLRCAAETYRGNFISKLLNLTDFGYIPEPEQHVPTGHLPILGPQR